MIYVAYGIGVVTDKTCQKWFAKFRVGDFSLDNDPQSGRPVEVDSNQIETLIEDNQHYTIREIAKEEPRWQRNRTGRPLSLLQIH